LLAQRAGNFVFGVCERETNTLNYFRAYLRLPGMLFVLDFALAADGCGKKLPDGYNFPIFRFIGGHQSGREFFLVLFEQGWKPLKLCDPRRKINESE